MDNLIQQEMVNLIRISWIVLIPVGVLLALVLYKLLMLLVGLVDLLTVARYELSPAMKDIRLLAEHAEFLSGKAAQSVKAVEKRMDATRPLVEKSLTGLQAVTGDLRQSVGAIWAGIRRSFK